MTSFDACQVLFFQGAEDAVVAFFAEGVAIFEEYRLMNRQRQLVTFYKPYFFAFWQNVIAAVDGHGDYGHLHLLGQCEGAFAEGHQPAGTGA